MIAEWACKYIGLPYKDAAWGPKQFDCWGLVAHIYKLEFNIDIIHGMTIYDNRISKVRRMQKYWHEWQPVNTPKIGDGILFLIAGKLPHCGVFIGDGKMIHSIENTSSCIQRLDIPKWKPRFEGYYRYSPSSS